MSVWGTNDPLQGWSGNSFGSGASMTSTTTTPIMLQAPGGHGGGGGGGGGGVHMISTTPPPPLMMAMTTTKTALGAPPGMDTSTNVSVSKAFGSGGVTIDGSLDVSTGHGSLGITQGPLSTGLSSDGTVSAEVQVFKGLKLSRELDLHGGGAKTCATVQLDNSFFSVDRKLCVSDNTLANGLKVAAVSTAVATAAIATGPAVAGLAAAMAAQQAMI